MKPLNSTVTKASRYTSMRVHGNSAHVEYTSPEPGKIVKVSRHTKGTLIQSNYPAQVEIYFSIPSPLIVDRKFSLISIFQRLFSGSVEKVFDGSHLRVVRVEVYIGDKNAVNLGQIRVMDGDRYLANSQISTLPAVDANTDSYLETPAGYFILELNHEVHTALGIELTATFTNFELEENQLQIIAAKAVFATGA
ncbi:MAG: hypothetical protein U0V02_09010 [Anaerolineales bacterium]